jgi:hypothetical protein
MRWIACVLVVGLATRSAVADRRGKDIVVEVPGERSLTTKLAIGGVAAAAVLAGAIGLHYNLDARSAADEVSASLFTGKAWTTKQAALDARASRSSTRAGIGYGVGGALLIGAIVAFIVTDPKTEKSVIRTSPAITPLQGGALLGGAWSF